MGRFIPSILRWYPIAVSVITVTLIWGLGAPAYAIGVQLPLAFPVISFLVIGLATAAFLWLRYVLRHHGTRVWLLIAVLGVFSCMFLYYKSEEKLAVYTNPYNTVRVVVGSDADLTAKGRLYLNAGNSPEQLLKKYAEEQQDLWDADAVRWRFLIVISLYLAWWCSAILALIAIVQAASCAHQSPPTPPPEIPIPKPPFDTANSRSGRGKPSPSERGGTQPCVDFVIITPLAEERDAILGMLGKYHKVNPAPNDPHVYFTAELNAIFPDRTDTTYKLVVAPLLNMGRVEAANAADHAIQRWQPRYILLVGIAGGYGKAGVQLGDVLIAKQVADYEEQNLQTNKTTIRWQVYQIDPGLVAQSQNLLDDSWTNLIKVERPRKGKTSIVHGLICTGDKVIANGLLGEFQQTWDRLIGVEMEAGGVARAAFQAGVSRPGFFMIRGVSDLADKNKKSRIVKKWRTYACHAAAAYTISLLKNGPVAPAQDRPHEPLPRHEDETSRLLAGTVMTAAEFINEPLLDTSEQEDVSTPELFAPSSQESALVEAAENGQGIIEPEGAGKGPTAWLLEAVRRVPTLKYAIGVVGLVAAAVISAALAFGHWQYALFGAIAVFGGMLLVRIYAASQPEHIRFNPSFAFHVVLWTCVIAFVLLVVMGLIRLGLNLFAAEREAVGEKPVPEIPSKDHADTPRKPAQYPSEQIIFDIPPREKVEKVSRLKPTEVTFKYKNNTGEDLELFLYSFSRHYDKNRKPSDATTAWFADWNFPATGKFGVFDRFQTGCGWYGFVVRGKKKSASGGYDHHLCCRDIFEHKVATLTVVAEAGNPDRPYKAVFGSEE